MTEQPFDEALEYDQMLERGLRISGEDKEFFARGRVEELVDQVTLPPKPRILDFGCGTGETTALLAATFPTACVVGVDLSRSALDLAAARHAGPRVRFLTRDELSSDALFDVCYCNGVFHHVPIDERSEWIRWIARRLRPGGSFALFENNPWNLGTRLVMRRIPFDRDAVPLSPPVARRLLLEGGFEVGRARFLFYFPRFLAWLRPLEQALRRLPGGAQYWYRAVKR